VTRGRAGALFSYGGAGIVSVALHVLLLFLVASAPMRRPMLPASRGRTAVDVVFERYTPPAPPQRPQPQRRPEPPPVPAAPAVAPPEPRDVAVPLEKLIDAPRPPAEYPAPRPAREDFPAPLSAPVQPHDRAFAADESGVSAPALAPDNGKPEYPRSCLMGMHRPDRSACEGSALFIVRVGADGKALSVTMFESAGCRHLDDSARKWLERARFIPATRSGAAVESSKEFVIQFSVKDYFGAGR